MYINILSTERYMRRRGRGVTDTQTHRNTHTRHKGTYLGGTDFANSACETASKPPRVGGAGAAVGGGTFVPILPPLFGVRTRFGCVCVCVCVCVFVGRGGEGG
jgi:hypothetical protein